MSSERERGKGHLLDGFRKNSFERRMIRKEGYITEDHLWSFHLLSVTYFSLLRVPYFALVSHFLSLSLSSILPSYWLIIQQLCVVMCFILKERQRQHTLLLLLHKHTTTRGRVFSSKLSFLLLLFFSPRNKQFLFFLVDLHRFTSSRYPLCMGSFAHRAVFRRRERRKSGQQILSNPPAQDLCTCYITWIA